MIEHGGGIIAREQAIHAALADALGLPADTPPGKLMAAADARARAEADALWASGACTVCTGCEYALLDACGHCGGDFPRD